MKKVWIIIAVVVISAALVLSLGGCAQKLASKLVEKAVEGAISKSGESVDINLENGEIKMTDEKGNEVSLGGTSAPKDWPSSVPINDNVKISFAGSSKTDGKSNWNISGTYNGSGQELYDWYKEKLSDFKVDSDSVSESDGEKLFALNSSNDQYIVTLWITENSTEVSIILNVSEK